MLKNILVPLDSSPFAESVIPHVVAVAKAFSARVIIAHILEQPSTSLQLPKADPLDWYLKRTAAGLYLDTVRAGLEQQHIPVETLLVDGDAAEKIVEITQSRPIDLVILNGYGEGSLSERGISSMVQGILQHIRTSTLIVRAQHVPEAPRKEISYQRLLVPLDGSQRAASVLPIVQAIAEAHHAEISLVHVVSKPEMPRHMPMTQEDTNLVNQIVMRNQEEGSRYLQQIKAHLSVNTKAQLLVSDNVAVTLQNIGEEDRIDLLVLSAHGYSGEMCWPYGNITNRFITDGTIPLLIIQDLQQDAPEMARSLSPQRTIYAN